MHRPQVHIVDDDPDIRDGLAWLFESRGLAPARWDGGQAFLDALPACSSDWGHAVVLLEKNDRIGGLLQIGRASCRERV